jgi:16S rRNA (cytosine967-C5)-methyltransferase
METELSREKWAQLAIDLNQQAPVDLRTNTLKTSRSDLLHALELEGIEARPLKNEVGVRLNERKNVFRTETFKLGWFEVQDYGSQSITPLLQIEPGQMVVDACAGAGGKTLQIASLMKNKGRLIALDVHAKKLEQNRIRCRRNGVSVADIRLIESSKTYKRLYDQADRLLLDVPCSGVGVIRRNPDTKWKVTPQELERLQELQRPL